MKFFQRNVDERTNGYHALRGNSVRERRNRLAVCRNHSHAVVARLANEVAVAFDSFLSSKQPRYPWWAAAERFTDRLRAFNKKGFCCVAVLTAQQFASGNHARGARVCQRW